MRAVIMKSKHFFPSRHFYKICRLIPVQLPVLHCFRNVHTGYTIACRQISNGARHLQDAMICPCGKIQRADGLL